ncbi:hypothetical protein ABDK00_008350 [Niabella insulamsoli]|uniref:hypothetical protein n=1 Tax=Niabella insulamsoli TaxID=3144874 RepID=UPI0031FD3EF1
MPDYSVQQLTSVSDCDAVLSIATKEQQDLEWKKLSLGRQKQQYADQSVSIAAELAGKQAELEVLDSIIAGLPEGNLKVENQNKKIRAEYSIFLLETRRNNYGDVALLEKELDLQRVERELEETAAFIAEVESRRATI